MFLPDTLDDLLSRVVRLQAIGLALNGGGIGKQGVFHENLPSAHRVTRNVGAAYSDSNALLAANPCRCHSRDEWE